MAFFDNIKGEVREFNPYTTYHDGDRVYADIKKEEYEESEVIGVYNTLYKVIEDSSRPGYAFTAPVGTIDTYTTEDLKCVMYDKYITTTRIECVVVKGNGEEGRTQLCKDCPLNPNHHCPAGHYTCASHTNNLEFIKADEYQLEKEFIGKIMSFDEEDIGLNK